MTDNIDRGKMTFGQVIRQRRIELGLTQEALAERVGESVRQSEISRLERDYVALPRRARLEALARALEVTPGYLLMRSGWIDDGEAVPLAPAETPSAPPLDSWRMHETIMSMVEPITDEELEQSVDLQDAIAHAREVSRQTGELLRESAQAIEAARRRHRGHA